MKYVFVPKLTLSRVSLEIEILHSNSSCQIKTEHPVKFKTQINNVYYFSNVVYMGWDSADLRGKDAAFSAVPDVSERNR